MGQDSAPASSLQCAPAATQQPFGAQGHSAQSVSLPDAAALLKAKVRLALNRVMAIYLSNLEEIRDEHGEAMQRLMDVLPEEHKAETYVANVFGDARFEAMRKHVLKAGNDACRELEEMISYLRLDSGRP